MKERPKSWRHLELILGIVQFQFEHFWFMSPVSLALPASKHVLSKEKQQLVGKEAGSMVQKKKGCSYGTAVGICYEFITYIYAQLSNE